MKHYGYDGSYKMLKSSDKSADGNNAHYSLGTAPTDHDQNGIIQTQAPEITQILKLT